MNDSKTFVADKEPVIKTNDPAPEPVSIVPTREDK